MPDTKTLLNFIQPDVPAEKKKSNEVPLRSSERPAVPTEDEQADHAFGGTSPMRPRFRSALEQVSYYTNESAEKRWK